MRWLWFIGPVIALVIYLFSTLMLTRRERQRRRELRRWVDELMGPLPGGRSRSVKRLPSSFDELISWCGGGEAVANVVLLPKLAYLAARAADRSATSAHITVICRLRKRAPTMVVRPLPVVEGKPIPNKGIPFPNDPEFMDRFLVEGQDSQSIIRWLRPRVRETLQELPDVWLRTEDRLMALTIYGDSLDAVRIDELVATADVIFAERGAGGGDSLFGEEEPPKKAKSKKPQAAAQQPVTYRLWPHDRQAGASEASDLPPADLGVRLKAAALDFALYGLAIVILVAVFGRFSWFHPEFMFNSEEIVVSEPWQGGWTTKGFGGGIIAECLLLGVLIVQAYLATTRGQSVGKFVFGAKIVHLSGKPTTFLSTVLLRTWILAAVPLGVAAALAKPLSWRTFFLRIPTWTTIGATVAVILLSLAPALLGHHYLHDYLARTRIVASEPWPGPDEATWRRVLGVVGLIALLVVFNVGLYYLTDYWIWQLNLDSLLGRG